jgi:hypothetical protein
MKSEMSNPFAVQTPEDISAEEAKLLFVNVYSEFYNVVKPGHTFLHGPRGSGKSMMFRCMLPDYQCLDRDIPLCNLDYLAIYVPIKSTDLHLTEMMRLENKHASFVINEHWIAINVAVRTFNLIAKLVDNKVGDLEKREAEEFYNKFFIRLTHLAGWSSLIPEITKNDTCSSIFYKMGQVCEDAHRAVLTYIRKLTFATEPVHYVGPVTGYLDFLLPLLKKLRYMTFLPKGQIFLLLDDADNLSETQTRILNTWVSYRTSTDVSIKASTQLGYKTWRTIAGQTIDTPHDFSEVNISAVYTTSYRKYYKRVDTIVQKRLENAGILATPETFFPVDEKQEKGIEEVKEEIKQNFENEGRGYRASDDVGRYARPIYMSRLKGTSKSGPTYKYAGFEQMVHISSGIIRHFLEAASLMYGEMLSLNPDKPVTEITPTIQDDIVRQLADQYLFSEFEKLGTGEEIPDASPSVLRKLRNLIEALGRVFELMLISNASQRRVFSIAFSDPTDDEINKVLKLGLRYGFFHESTIGTKDGTGRTKLYILSRRLAPHFGLDPTGFAGYKFITTKAIHEAMENPNSFVGRAKRQGDDKIFTDDDEYQLKLFE